jgi:uncharacterized RDD family membrane protein YckC
MDIHDTELSLDKPEPGRWGTAEARERGPARQAVTDEDQSYVGVVTRAVSWVIDAVAINVAAIATGLGIELFLSIFPVRPSFASVLKPIAAAAYVVWAAAYFVVFWSWTGQTLGARLMQIRLVRRNGGRVKPARALVRWIGMNLAMIPLFAGFYPILVGRRGFPDWLAHTQVLPAPQLSIAEKGQAAMRQARQAKRRGAIPLGYEPGPSAVSDGGVPPLEAPERSSQTPLN